WNAAAGATSYVVKRAVNSGSFITIATNITTTNYLDSAFTNGTTLSYVVLSVNAYGSSPPSNEVVVVVPFPQLSAIAAVSNQVMLSWSNAANPLNLRSTTNLTPPIIWSPITNVPI